MGLLAAERHPVSVVPGAAIGLSPHFRISTAASEADLREARARITRIVATLEEAV